MIGVRPIIYFAIVAWLSSCSSDQRSIVITEFSPLYNYEFEGDTLVMEMDLDAGPFRGIRLPSARKPVGKQTFQFAFKAQNTSNRARRVAYKIYYQNDSYRHPETVIDETGREIYNTKSSENFYGSWVSDSLEGFRKTAPISANEQIVIQDEVTILGNPLNERTYFDGNPIDQRFREIDIQEAVAEISLQPNLLSDALYRSDSAQVDTLKALRKAAIQTLLSKKADYLENQRWQRNPRVGCYRFMLVAGDAESIAMLPNTIRNMGIEDPELRVRINPFYFFRYGGGSIDALSSGITVLESQKVLKTYAVLSASHGIYYNYFDFDSIPAEFNTVCSSTDELYMLAHFEQHVDRWHTPLPIGNIDEAANVGGMSYPLKQYLSNVKSGKRILDTLFTPEQRPCENIYYYPLSESIGLQNPGNAKRPFAKRNAGVQGRVGFAYGRYRARIRFPEMLSKEGVWNGLTYAYALVNQSENRGGIKTNETAARKPLIELEITKDSKLWPGAIDAGLDTANYHPEKDHNLIVAGILSAGAGNIKDESDRKALSAKGRDRTYLIYRPETAPERLVQKSERPAARTAGQTYYYEIEWKPESVSWKMGPSPGQMEEVGYVNVAVSAIPNQQMVPLIRQEFQPTGERPFAPFAQRHIPYPSMPINGLVYEIVIE